ncbi:MAG: hypothetical protein ABSC94_04195 [Polyangiaceae bacterium]|jgi:glucose/arabinose dehydrogenase
MDPNKLSCLCTLAGLAVTAAACAPAALLSSASDASVTDSASSVDSTAAFDSPSVADAALAADSTVADSGAVDSGAVDAPLDMGVPPALDAAIANPCSLSGSILFTASGKQTVGNLPSGSPDLSFIQLPPGFCLHYYATVGNARQIRVAPGGELFVASPSTPTTGGGPGGENAIVVLPDDNHDGVGDSPVTFLSNLGSTQGILFARNTFYYQDALAIRQLPYVAGQRKAAGPGAIVTSITIYESALHWPKTLDMADDGTLYVGNGGDQGETCDITRPFHGGILKLDGTDGGAPVAKGLRNPIAVRCWEGHATCFALELAKDYSAAEGGREKLIPIRQGDDWGFPCCATQNVPYGGVTTTDCSETTPDTDSFLIGDTPFGLDFAPGSWPGNWANAAIVATHGAAGSWTGARVVAVGMDGATGLPQPATDIDGSDQGAMVDFATGWDDGSLAHGRPAAVTFAPDGRLFLANDTNGIIVWIAPIAPMTP